MRRVFALFDVTTHVTPVTNLKENTDTCHEQTIISIAATVNRLGDTHLQQQYCIDLCIVGEYKIAAGYFDLVLAEILGRLTSPNRKQIGRLLRSPGNFSPTRHLGRSLDSDYLSTYLPIEIFFNSPCRTSGWRNPLARCQGSLANASGRAEFSTPPL